MGVMDKWETLVFNKTLAPSLSIGPPVIAALRPLNRLIFDVHLMVEELDRYLEADADAGADVLVAGSAILGSDSERKIKEFHAMIRKRAGSSGGVL